MGRQIRRGPHPTRAERTRYCQQCGELAVIEHRTRDGEVCDHCLFTACQDPMEAIDLEDYVYEDTCLGKRVISADKSDIKYGTFSDLKEGLDRIHIELDLMRHNLLYKNRFAKIMLSKDKTIPYPRGGQ